MSDELNFDITRTEIPFRHGGKKFWLVEPSEDAASRWRNFTIKAVRFGKDGSPSGVEGIADGQSYLLSLCVYRANDDGALPIDSKGDLDPKMLVSQSTIKSWPSRIVRPLFERAKEIGDLREGKEPTAVELRKTIADAQAKLAELADGDSAPKGEPAQPTAS